MTKYLFILLAYLIGSIPFSYILGKYIKKGDIRKHGSGNLGTTNAFRVFGAIIGIAVLILDTLKSGILVLAIANDWFGVDMFHPLIYGSVAVLGHIYPVWMKFKGGKGVASSFGMLIFYYWPIPVLLLPVFVTTLLLSKFASLASTVVTVCAFIAGVILYFVGVPEIDLYYVVITGLLMLLILFKHRSNFKRILAGNENKIEFKKKKKI